MSTVRTDVKEMLFGIEITLVGGFVFFYGLLSDTRILWGIGVIAALLGLWLTAAAYAGRGSVPVGTGSTGDVDSGSGNGGESGSRGGGGTEAVEDAD